MVRLDLKDAYLHVPTDSKHQKFLRFRQSIQHWQFKVLPFGLAASPRIFTKVLAEVVSFLHLQGVALNPYLDAMLIYCPALEQLWSDCDKVLFTQDSLGWMVSREKSSLDPSQSKVYLGYVVLPPLGAAG